MPVSRDELISQVLLAGRSLSTAAIMFHSALADRRGLSATETRAVDLLERFGPLTAGELSERSGLAPASVTGLVDRLEQKGFAHRARHPQDRRRVLIEIDAERVAEGASLFDDALTSMTHLCAGYTDEQLETVRRFLTEAAQRQQAATAALADRPATPHS